VYLRRWYGSIQSLWYENEDMNLEAPLLSLLDEEENVDRATGTGGMHPFPLSLTRRAGGLASW